MEKSYQPKTGRACTCRKGVQRDNCAACEGTGQCIDFAAIRNRATQRPDRHPESDPLVIAQKSEALAASLERQAATGANFGGMTPYENFATAASLRHEAAQQLPGENELVSLLFDQCGEPILFPSGRAWHICNAVGGGMYLAQSEADGIWSHAFRCDEDCTWSEQESFANSALAYAWFTEGAK